MANVGLPKINILFTGLGTSAIQRGVSGVACLIIKDSTDQSFDMREYRSVEDLTSEELAKYTPENSQYIKDCLAGSPQKVMVFRMDTDGALADTLTFLSTKAPMNCWIAIASSVAADQTEVSIFVINAVSNSKKRYKALVYNTAADDMHVVNFTNSQVTFVDSRGLQNGNVALPYLLGYLAGLPTTMSAIAKKLTAFSYVEESADLEAAVNNGEFVLYNDEYDVMVARGVNSLTTTGSGITDDMKFIHVVEIMDLMYTDIYTTWKDNYRGRYPNILDNQMLLIGALNSYFKELGNDFILDPDYANKVAIDIQAQKLANIIKYGEDVVNTWDDNKIMQMTVGTNVYLKANIKILNIQEDIDLEILM